MEVKYKSLQEIGYKTPGAAGIDLPTVKQEIIKKGTVTKVSTGVSVEIPEGYVGILAVRSGLAANGVTLVNGIGIIDSDYRGEIGVMLTNVTDNDIELEAFDRVGQLIIMEYTKAELIKAPELSETERGEGGFGSTGLK